MPHADVLRTLVEELKRVGVDADNMVAGLSARADDAIRALRALPDGAGPAAFLARLRLESEVAHRPEVTAHADGSPGDTATRGEASARSAPDADRESERRTAPMDRTA